METTEITTIKNQVEIELANKETVATLVSTTFKGLQPDTMKRALIEGMMRGFSFKDFLEKNVYAVPFASGYSLVTSIDHSRKIGMRSGVIGKSAPVFEENNGKIVSCSITIKRRVGNDIGEFTSLVYFDEYNTGKNQWVTKPRTMIAKVAESHALRMACPEELSQSYVEEEMIRDIAPSRTVHDTETFTKKIKAVQTEEELKTVWSALPMEVKLELKDMKDEMKKKLAKPIEEKVATLVSEIKGPKAKPITAEEVAELEAESAEKTV